MIRVVHPFRCYHRNPRWGLSPQAAACSGPFIQQLDRYSWSHLQTAASPYARHQYISSLPFALSTSPIQDFIADYNNIDFILPITLTGLRKLIISHNRLNIGLIRTPLPSMHHLDIRHNPAIQFADRSITLPNVSRYYHDPAPGYALMPAGM